MSEYKENTVGWWLSQLKEPLRSLAFGVYRKPEFLYRPAKKMCDATNILSWSIKGDTAFWDGVDAFFRQDVTRDHLYPSRWKGWDMANKCAPDNWLKPKDGGEDKAIVYSPEPAVVGYEAPLPVDTIEKKHELRIQNLEGQVKYLEDMVGSLLRSLEIITKQLSKNG